LIMDDRTGELIHLNPGEETPPGFDPVAIEMQQAATEALAGRKSIIIDPTGRGPMSQYLRDRRRAAEKRKARNRRKRKSAKRT